MKDYTGPFILFALLGGIVLYAIAACVFGWAGVLGLAVASVVFGHLARKEAARNKAARDRADEIRIQRWAWAEAQRSARSSTQRRSPRRARGGAR